jgi:hypothetical protein
MILLTTLLLALPVAPAAQDRIERSDGRAVLGKLTNASLVEVVYAGGDGKETKLAAADVLGLVPAPSSDLMRTGERAWEQHDWAAAANAFSAAASETGGPAWLPAWAGLRHGEALVAWARAERAKAGEAVAALRTWTGTHADSYWLPRARLAQSHALVLAGDGAGAEQLLTELLALVFEKGLAKHLDYEINLERCRAFLASRQPEVAEARLRDLVDKEVPADAARGVRSRLLTLRGQAQILLGEAIEAKSGARTAAAYWEGLARDTRATTDVRAAALTGLANAAVSEGRLRDAQLQLAEVVAVLDAGDEVRARALWDLHVVTEKLGDHPVNHRIYLERILRECPDSTWAEPARTKLGR